MYLFPEPRFSAWWVLKDLLYSIQTEPHREDKTPAAGKEAIGIFLAIVGKKEATELIGEIKADSWTRDHLSSQMLLEMADLHEYDP